jgi:DNA-binding beta-propeller fold protein YncE
VAGNGSWGYADGLAHQASFELPRDVASSGDGRVFVADQLAHAIRVIENGVVSTFAGGKGVGYRDGPAAEAMFYGPAGIALGPDGALYVADAENHRIRKIYQGMVTTVAGSGIPGHIDGPALSAAFEHPVDVDVDVHGNIYSVDLCNYAIRKINTRGEVSTLVGSDADLSIERARYVAVGPSGTVYFTDGERNLVRKINPQGQVSVLAGVAFSGMVDGATGSSRFYEPSGIAVDEQERVFVADTGNRRIRMIEGNTVTVIAGTGYIGGQDGAAEQATFFKPLGLAYDGNGHLFVADTQLANIRRVTVR